LPAAAFGVITDPMSRARNLADPGYEPTDAELEGLMRAAFSEVRAAREREDQRLYARVAAGQAESRRRLAVLLARRT
jgi:hypothetical protein